MLDSLASDFRDLVSGKRRGVGPALARGALRLAEVPYSLAVRWRNRQYDSGAKPVERVAVPVISVGNLTLGGTGKTPMVEWICHWLRGRGIRVTIVSRGYKAEHGAANDEALELEQKLPDVPHVQNPDRVTAARMAIEEFDCQAIVLDDAFQHRRIARDLDIVLLDALAPFGFEHVFPRGTLREPLAGLARAHCVVLTRADMATTEERAQIAQRVARLAPGVVWAECVHKPIALRSASGEERDFDGFPKPLSPQGRGWERGKSRDNQQPSPCSPPERKRDSQPPLDSLRGRHVAAFCGIGNPAGFRHTLASCGYDVSLFREFPDHHAYSRSDLESLADWARQAEVAAVLCTHKDLVKIGLDRLGDKPLFAVSIGVEFQAGLNELQAQLAAVCSRAAASPLPKD
jgi:tetraacyldisaccharide 4'-kinase